MESDAKLWQYFLFTTSVCLLLSSLSQQASQYNESFILDYSNSIFIGKIDSSKTTCN